MHPSFLTFNFKNPCSLFYVEELLISSFTDRDPLIHYAAEFASKLRDYLAEIFFIWDETRTHKSGDPKIVIVLDISSVYIMDDSENTFEIIHECRKFSSNSKDILTSLTNYMELPDDVESKLIEIPPLERFEGVEYKNNKEAEDEEKLCAICYEELSENGKKTCCSHLFHGNCLARWLCRKTTCPMCRFSLN
ncbi:hypothetical protein ACFE04_008192 [Oxalis oulophora]